MPSKTEIPEKLRRMLQVRRVVGKAIPKPLKNNAPPEGKKRQIKPIKKRVDAHGKTPKTPIAKLRLLLDGLWSEAVRLQWGGICGVCGKAGTQAHHYFAKKPHPSVRHDPQNGILLCFVCHIINAHRAHNLEPSRDAIIACIGEEDFAKLKKKAYGPGKHGTLTTLEREKEELVLLINRIRMGR